MATRAQPKLQAEAPEESLSTAVAEERQDCLDAGRRGCGRTPRAVATSMLGHAASISFAACGGQSLTSPQKIAAAAVVLDATGMVRVPDDFSLPMVKLRANLRAPPMRANTSVSREYSKEEVQHLLEEARNLSWSGYCVVSP